jgi:hypothetical protein
MVKNELVRRSPIRILEKSAHGGVGKGNIGIIAARKGVGKTACLVHVATDMLIRGRKVIHVSFADSTGHILAWYEEIFNKIADRFNLDGVDLVHDDIIRNRIVMNFSREIADFAHIAERIRSLILGGGFAAEAIIVDGYDFAGAAKEDLAKFKDLAAELGCEVWFSATVPETRRPGRTQQLPALLQPFKELCAIIIRLEPARSHVKLRLVKDHERTRMPPVHLELDPEIMLISEEPKPLRRTAQKHAGKKARAG